MSSLPLIAAWDALLEEPCSANFGGNLVLSGKKVDLSHYRAFTEMERLDGLNYLVSSKEYLVIAPSVGGSYVPITRMTPEELIFAATTKAKLKSFSIIDAAILPVFEELVSLLKDVDPAVAS